MPTIAGHALVGWATARGASPALDRDFVKPLAVAAALLAVLPDLDVVSFGLGIPYAAKLGHRGFSHSLAFAAVSALVGYVGLRWHRRRRGGAGPGALVYSLLFVAAASHPLLDMLTDGGLGVALFAPFSWTRCFFPITPIPVSAIGVDESTGFVLAWEAALLAPLAIAAELVGRSRRRAPPQRK
jgi:inner membrane protein